MRTFWPPQADFFLASSRGTVWGNVSVSLPRDGNGTGGWKATLLMGRDYAISWRSRTRRVRGTGREYSRENGRHIVGKSVGKNGREVRRKHGRETLSGMVGNTMGNRGWRHRLKKRGELLPSPIYRKSLGLAWIGVSCQS